MATITFNKFDLGIDHQKGAAVADANRLIEMKNAHVTSGLATEKRSGLTKVATLETGTKGLFSANGKLNTFYCGEGTITHANPLFVANKLTSTTYANVALKDVPFVDMFNGYFYVAATHTNGNTRHYYNGTEIPAQITVTENGQTTTVNNPCPHTPVCYKANSKIFAVGADGETVRFSKTADCTDWYEPNDAGFLPTGMNARGAREIKAIGMYQGRMCFLMRDGVQVWTVDPDPTAMSLEKTIDNVGSSFSRSLATVSGDLYFLSDYGFRSITTYNLTYQLGDVDIGTPIDDIVRKTIRARGGYEPLTVYFYGTGKYMCAIGRQVFVYSVSRTAKIAAWSRYELPVAVDAWAELEGVLYLRSGDDVYKLDEDEHQDDGEDFEVLIQIPYMNFKKPGMLKHIYGIDLDIDGDCYVSVGTDARTYKGDFTVNSDCTIEYDNSGEYFTDEMRVVGRSYAGAVLPIECVGTEFSFRFRCTNEKPFRLNALTVYYNELGVL